MTKQRILIPGLVLLAVGALGTSIFLWRQNTELRRRAATAQRPSNQGAPVERVREGNELPAFTGLDTEGKEVRVAARGTGRTLLFIFSPTCDRCEAGMSAWIKLNNRLGRLGARINVVGLSIADSYTTVEHARRIKAPFAVVPFPNLDLQKRYGATEVPLTVVLDARGIVQAVWDKPLDEGEVGDVIEVVCPECLQQADSVRASISEGGISE